MTVLYQMTAVWLLTVLKTGLGDTTVSNYRSVTGEVQFNTTPSPAGDTSVQIGNLSSAATVKVKNTAPYEARDHNLSRRSE